METPQAPPAPTPAEEGTSERKPRSPKPRKKGGITFGEVRVREHELVLNKRASALYAGLELGWGHHSSQHHLIDDFEQKKVDEGHEKKKHKDHERLQALARYGYSTKEILAVEKEKKKALELREKGIEVPNPDDEPEKPKSRGFKSLLPFGRRKKQ